MLRKYVFYLMLVPCLLVACSGDQKAGDADSKEGLLQDAPPPVETKNILFFGTSLTAGLGLDPSEAYPSLIQQKIDSAQMAYKVINGGLSGETSAAGKERIGWLLKQPVDIFVLELGSNDGLRGIPVTETTKNLQYIIDQVKEKYPNARLVLAGMQMPPSMGNTYAAAFKNMFPLLAQKNGMTLIPFLLDKVGGVADYNQKDGIHPNAAGAKILADNVWEKLQALL